MEEKEAAFEKIIIRKSGEAVASENNLCFYDGLAYSIGSYLSVDGLHNMLLLCKADGTWDLKEPPSKKSLVDKSSAEKSPDKASKKLSKKVPRKLPKKLPKKPKDSPTKKK